MKMCTKNHHCLWINKQIPHSLRMAFSVWHSISMWLVHWWAKPISLYIDNHSRCQNAGLAPVLGICKNLLCLSTCQVCYLWLCPRAKQQWESCLWHSPKLMLLAMLVVLWKSSANDRACPIRFCFHLCDYGYKLTLFPWIVCTPV